MAQRMCFLFSFWCKEIIIIELDLNEKYKCAWNDVVTLIYNKNGVCMNVCMCVTCLIHRKLRTSFFEGQILPYFSWPTYIAVLAAYKNIILPSIRIIHHVFIYNHYCKISNLMMAIINEKPSKISEFFTRCRKAYYRLFIIIAPLRKSKACSIQKENAKSVL